MSEVFETFEEHTGINYDDVSPSDWHSVYTVKLGELIELGLFDWGKPYLEWEIAAYDEEQ